MDAVLFDWRGTLAVHLERSWVAAALAVAGRDVGDTSAVLDGLRPFLTQLDVAGMDADPRVHARIYRQVLADAGLGPDLVEALYAVESDPMANPFAVDTEPTLRALRDAGVRVAVVSDIHVDIRPAFAVAGLDSLVDTFTLSYENPVLRAGCAEARSGDVHSARGGAGGFGRAHPDGG